MELFKAESKRLLIKAAGGVRDKKAAEEYIKMGVSRIGTSTGTVLIQDKNETNQKPSGY